MRRTKTGTTPGGRKYHAVKDGKVKSTTVMDGKNSYSKTRNAKGEVKKTLAPHNPPSRTLWWVNTNGPLPEMPRNVKNGPTTKAPPKSRSKYGTTPGGRKYESHGTRSSRTTIVHEGSLRDSARVHNKNARGEKYTNEGKSLKKSFTKPKEK